MSIGINFSASEVRKTSVSIKLKYLISWDKGMGSGILGSSLTSYSFILFIKWEENHLPHSVDLKIN